MKKFIAFVLTFALVLSLGATTVLADAIGDWNQGNEASYDVEVTAPDGYVNIRTGPGTGYDVIDKLYNGEVVRILYESDDGRWGQIVFNTREFGWIALSQTTRTSGSEPTPAPTSTPKPTAQSVYSGGSSCNYQVIVSAPDGGVNLRFGPSTDYDIRVSMIPNDTILTVTAEKGGWGRTNYRGTDGWIALSQVSDYVPLEIEEEVEPTPSAEPTQTAEAVPAPQVSETVDTVRDESDVVQQLQMQQLQNQAAEAESKMGFMGKLILIGVIVFLLILAAVIALCIWMKKTQNTQFFEEYDGYGAQTYTPEYEGEHTDAYADAYAEEYTEEYTEEYAEEEYAEEPVEETAEEIAEEPAQKEAAEETAEPKAEEAAEEASEEPVAEKTAREVVDESVTKAAVKDKDLKADAKDLKKKF